MPAKSLYIFLPTRKGTVKVSNVDEIGYFTNFKVLSVSVFIKFCYTNILTFVENSNEQSEDKQTIHLQ